MTDAHQDVAGVVAQLRERLSRLGSSPEQLINFMTGIGPLLTKSATLIESLSKALSEAEAERDRHISRCAALVKLDEWSSNQNKVLVANKTEWMDRALAAESRLSEAMKVIEPFAEIDPVDAMFPIRVQTADVQAARAFLNAGKE
jgi:hypothetical protein